MTSGPPPMPNELRVLNGGRSASPDRIRNNPQPPDVPAEKPAYIEDDAAASEVWDRIAPDLLAMGHVKRVDTETLAMLCQQLATYHRAYRHVAEHGPVIDVETRDGWVQRRNPASAVMRESMAAIIQISGRFGMTPSDRARIVIPTDDEATEGEDFFSIGS